MKDSETAVLYFSHPESALAENREQRSQNPERRNSVMKDSEIVALYLSRSESALTESRNHYGRLIQHIIRNIIRNPEDAEECENDTYLSAWQSIPPNQPKSLKAYLAVIARIPPAGNGNISTRKNAIRKCRFLLMNSVTASQMIPVRSSRMMR
ncbi:MAG: hypothetical protein IJ644_07975 [Oscillospiraceae bacterium]|nr:hypothetical protein [Oscillospiraceae bacterium]